MATTLQLQQTLTHEVVGAYVDTAEIYRHTIDLGDTLGGRIFVRIGRSGAVAAGYASPWYLRPVGSNFAQPSIVRGNVLDSASANVEDLAAAITAGDTSFTVADGHGSEFARGDIIMIGDGSSGGNNVDFCKVARVNSSGNPDIVYLDSAVRFSHDPAEGARATTKGFVQEVVVPPGQWEFILDHSQSTDSSQDELIVDIWVLSDDYTQQVTV